jgi:hypothetical protein
MQSTVAPRAGRIALTQGLIFGVILGIIEIILIFVGQYIGGFSTLLVYVLYLGIPVIAGFRASAQTGRVSTGLLAGLYTGLFASIIYGIVQLIYTFINVDSLRQSIQGALNSANTNFTVTNGYVITFAIIGIVVILIIATLLGLAGGSIGGAFGKRRMPVQTQTYQDSMFQAPPTNYPSANYPPQDYPPPPQNYPPAQQ